MLDTHCGGDSDLGLLDNGDSDLGVLCKGDNDLVI